MHSNMHIELLKLHHMAVAHHRDKTPLRTYRKAILFFRMREMLAYEFIFGLDDICS